MANPIPCGICREVDSAEFLITDTTPDAQIMGQPTQGVCVRCFIEKGLQMAQALQDVLSEEATPAADQPGVLEQVEADEGKQGIAPSSASPKSRKATPAKDNGAQAAQEAEAAHVDR